MYHGLTISANTCSKLDKLTGSLLQIGFAKTTGFLANMRKKDPKRADPVPAFQEDLLKIMGTTDLDCLITLNWHTIILLAKEPVPLKG